MKKLISFILACIFLFSLPASAIQDEPVKLYAYKESYFKCKKETNKLLRKKYIPVKLMIKNNTNSILNLNNNLIFNGKSLPDTKEMYEKTKRSKFKSMAIYSFVTSPYIPIYIWLRLTYPFAVDKKPGDLGKINIWKRFSKKIDRENLELKKELAKLDFNRKKIIPNSINEFYIYLPKSEKTGFNNKNFEWALFSDEIGILNLKTEIKD